MKNKFRNSRPCRTCTKTYKNYRSFKKYLAEDFNNKCGYTNCSDFWFGGVKTFHIDHFQPLSKYPHLKTTYANLVYSCSYINILKSDDDGDYIDPCDEDFNLHFERDKNGFIIPISTSTSAVYMYSKLKLGLRRYAIIWKLDELLLRAEKLEKAIEKTENQRVKEKLQIFHSNLSTVIHSYLRGLRENQ